MVVIQVNFEERQSKRAKSVKSSMIRELLKYVSDPTFISFGGGAPDPDTFPRNEMAEIAKEVIEKEYRFTLQYGLTEGDPILREEFIKLLNRRYGIEGLDVENVVITVGSQQALDLIGKVFLDEDSVYFISAPAYVGALSAFLTYSKNYITIPLEDDGLSMDILESKLKELDEKGELKKLKFVYTVPTFHNPAGVTMSLEKRKRLIELSERYDFIIVEDDPYSALRYEGEDLPSIFKLAGKERVILLNTFSKIFSPGVRIGAVVGRKDIILKVSQMKQGADLCTPSLTQRLTARYLQRYDIFEHLKKAIEVYRKKRDLMLKGIEENMKDVDVKYVKPMGGLFIWVKFPDEFDTLEMLEIAKKNKILYIPGSAFHPDGGGRNTLRLSFCLPPEEKIVEGMRRLGRTIREYFKGV